MGVVGCWATAKLFGGGYDWSGTLNVAQLTHESEMKDVSVFSDRTKRFRAGLANIKASLKGFVELTDDGQDEQSFANIGAVNAVPVSLFAANANVSTGIHDIGGVAYFFEGEFVKYSPGGKVGDILGYEVDAVGRGTRMVRGFVLSPGAALVGTGNGTGTNNPGAALSTQHVYAVLHVVETAGGTPSGTFVIESDDNSGFTSATTRFTFGPLTARGAFFATPLAGAITDTYWRLKRTVTSGTFRVACAVGILV